MSRRIVIQLDEEHEPEETVAEIARQLEAGNTSGYYPHWDIEEDDTASSGRELLHVREVDGQKFWRKGLQDSWHQLPHRD